MKIVLQILGAVLLIFSTAGIAFHALAKVEGFGHHCEMLLVSPLDENHLAAFTLTAGLSATFFFIARKKRERKVKKMI